MLPIITPMTHEERADYLTPIQRRFVQEYAANNFNGAAAYMAATGNTNKKSASVQASKYLKKDKIQAYLKEYVKEVLGPLEKTLLGNVEFWVTVRDNPQARNSDRLKASEMLAKYAQMFVEKKEVNLSGQVQIVDDI